MFRAQDWKLRLAPGLFSAYRHSLRARLLGPDDVSTAPPFIFACLHRDMLPALICVESFRPVLLVSRSLDGDILTATMQRRGFDFVRGSTGAQGGEAFRALLQKLKQGHILGLAVDGPRGPFGAVHEGVLHLSRLAGVPIIPLRHVAKSCYSLNTWDRTRIPKPFSRLTVGAGDPILVPQQADAADLQTYADVLRGALWPEGRGDV